MTRKSIHVFFYCADHDFRSTLLLTESFQMKSWKMYFLISANRKNRQAVHEYKEDDKTTHLKKVIPMLFLFLDC